MEDRSNWPSEAELISELRATFPGLRCGPLSQDAVPGFDHGCNVGGETCMPDGYAIFSGLVCSDPDIYNGDVHRGFEKWLELRGWYVEPYDYVSYLVVPIAQLDAMAADWNAAVAAQPPSTPLQPGECPF